MIQVLKLENGNAVSIQESIEKLYIEFSKKSEKLNQESINYWISLNDSDDLNGIIKTILKTVKVRDQIDNKLFTIEFIKLFKQSTPYVNKSKIGEFPDLISFQIVIPNSFGEKIPLSFILISDILITLIKGNQSLLNQSMVELILIKKLLRGYDLIKLILNKIMETISFNLELIEKQYHLSIYERAHSKAKNPILSEFSNSNFKYPSSLVHSIINDNLIILNRLAEIKKIKNIIDEIINKFTILNNRIRTIIDNLPLTQDNQKYDRTIRQTKRFSILIFISLTFMLPIMILDINSIPVLIEFFIISFYLAFLLILISAFKLFTLK
jgi:hypothetical protein